jgi:hypothetical protein
MTADLGPIGGAWTRWMRLSRRSGQAADSDFGQISASDVAFRDKPGILSKVWRGNVRIHFTCPGPLGHERGKTITCRRVKIQGGHRLRLRQELNARVHVVQHAGPRCHQISGVYPRQKGQDIWGCGVKIHQAFDITNTNLLPPAVALDHCRVTGRAAGQGGGCSPIRPNLGKDRLFRQDKTLHFFKAGQDRNRRGGSASLKPVWSDKAICGWPLRFVLTRGAGLAATSP